jgi:hypothetical protein
MKPKQKICAHLKVVRRIEKAHSYQALSNSCRPDMAVEPSPLMSFAASLVVQSNGSNTVQLLGSEQEYTMDNGPFLDHQIEGYIQANILQCCLLSRSLPQFLQF